MAEITAKLVNDLRSKTGQGMMECKKALSECGGDMDKALDYFRKKGAKASLTERAATEGRVVGVATEDRRAGALVEVNCNTDFTAKSEPVLRVASKAAKLLAHNPEADVINAVEVSSEVAGVAQTTGENGRIGRAGPLDPPGRGGVGLFLVRLPRKNGRLKKLKGNPTEELIKQLGGH